MDMQIKSSVQCLPAGCSSYWLQLARPVSESTSARTQTKCRVPGEATGQSRFFPFLLPFTPPPPFFFTPPPRPSVCRCGVMQHQPAKGWLPCLGSGDAIRSYLARRKAVLSRVAHWLPVRIIPVLFAWHWLFVSAPANVNSAKSMLCFVPQPFIFYSLILIGRYLSRGGPTEFDQRKKCFVKLFCLK